MKFEPSQGGQHTAVDGLFNEYLARLNGEAMASYLETLRTPVWECELMHVALPAVDMISGPALELYRWHFVLFHCLYRQQQVFAERGRYLYIHFMRTCVRDFPAAGCCNEFDSEALEFCAARCSAHEQKCELHAPETDEMALDALSERYFYLDTSNFVALAAENAEKFIGGAWNLLQNHDEYQRCLKILGLPEGVTLDLLKKRFRYLARTLHPDLNKVHHEQFACINTAYRTLLKFMAL